MTPHPVALGVTLCDHVIVEERTRRLSTIRHFVRFSVQEFPSPPTPFCVLATLVEGRGEGRVELKIQRLDNDERIHTIQSSISFPDPLTQVNALFRVADCSFPVAGVYEAVLSVDDQEVARRRFQVL